VTLIDRRVLVDAPPDAVWQILSDPNALARWHAEYTSVSLLTPDKIGVGTRRRCTIPNRKDVIEQITAWVEGRGYEYTHVEGPYRDFRGRIRLQASPDGTSIHWTIAYQPKGLLGQLRELFGGKRRRYEMMSKSLKALRREIDALGVRMDADARAKVGIHERLDAEERANYQRRHPTPPAPESAPEPAAPSPAEPPPAAADPNEPAIPPDSEPSFVAELTSQLQASDEPDYSHTADTQPKRPPGLDDAIAEQQAQPGKGEAAPQDTAPPAPTPADQSRIPAHMRVTPAHGTPTVPPQDDTTPAVESPREPDAPDDTPVTGDETPPPARPTPAPTAEPEPTPSTPQRPVPPPESPPISELEDDTQPTKPGLPPQTPKTDTGEISIWEAFGLERPSEQDEVALDTLLKSVEARRIQKLRVAGKTPKRPVPVRQPPRTLGLRLRLALQAVRVRLWKGLFAKD
jgi:ligand-binding SRPBCC domain-containing protein